VIRHFLVHCSIQMLFNSHLFIFVFLPVTLAGYFLLGRCAYLAPVIWLTLASLIFYGSSSWQFVPLLLGSIAFNYVIGLVLVTGKRPAVRVAAVTVGVVGDLLLLGVFKWLPGHQSQRHLLDRANGRHPVADRHLLLHFYPDRVPGGCLPRQGRPLRLAILRAVCDLFSTFDRGTDPAPQGHDPAVRARRGQAPRAASDPVRSDHFCDRPVQEDGSGRRHPAAGGACVWSGSAIVRPGLDRCAGLHLSALFRFLRLLRHGDRDFPDVSASFCH
jgi:hypothetical protein